MRPSISARLPVYLVLLFLVLLLAFPQPPGASANGSVRLVVIDEVAGPYLLRVGVLPADPIAGPLHLSILILDAQTKDAVEDATVQVVRWRDLERPVSTDALNSPQKSRAV